MTLPQNTDEIGEAIASEAASIMGAMVSLYVDLVPSAPSEGDVVAKTDNEQRAFLHGGIYAFMLAAARGDSEAAHGALDRLITTERTKRATS